MIDKNKVLIGADPEVFLYYDEDSEFVPVIGMLGGTKAEPLPLKRKGYYVQEDNVMAEFNIPATKDPSQFIDSIKYCLTEIEQAVPDPLHISIQPSANFKSEYLDHPMAKISGCDPFFNAWTGEMEEVSLEETNNRFCGGHVHIGYPNQTPENRIELTKALDLFQGIPSVLLDRDNLRRETYGKAGAFREKEYGLEYRSLSNFWLQSEELMLWIFNSIYTAIDFVNSGKKVSKTIPDIINTSDKTKAEKLVKQFNLLP